MSKILDNSVPPILNDLMDGLMPPELNDETSHIELHVNGVFDSVVAEFETPLWKALIREFLMCRAVGF